MLQIKSMLYIVSIISAIWKKINGQFLSFCLFDSFLQKQFKKLKKGINVRIRRLISSQEVLESSRKSQFFIVFSYLGIIQ